MKTVYNEVPMARYWINQPSKYQQYHKLHGLNVLAQKDLRSKRFTRIYFVSFNSACTDSVISQNIAVNVLETGWK